MAMLVSLDWRHGLVTVQLSHDPGGGLRLALRHGPDELVVHLSESDRAALTWASLLGPRPTAAPGSPAPGGARGEPAA